MAGFSRLQFVFLFFFVASMSTIQVSLVMYECHVCRMPCCMRQTMFGNIALEQLLDVLQPLL
ncbi:hypothetical protein CsSME_00015664 [Camellia sinensis var. sinensis]